MTNRLMEWFLFKSPVSLIAKVGCHFREVQMRYLFAEEKPTIQQIIGLKKLT